MDNSEFITIHVTNEVGEEKEIDHIKDREHHHAATTTGGGNSSSTNIAAAATSGKGPNEHYPHISPTSTATKLHQPSTSGQDKYEETISIITN